MRIVFDGFSQSSPHRILENVRRNSSRVLFVTQHVLVAVALPQPPFVSLSKLEPRKLLGARDELLQVRIVILSFNEEM